MMEIEKIIRRIEEMKRYACEEFGLFEGLADPSVLAQHSQRMLGVQLAYDNVIHLLREYQGCDDE